LKPQNIEISAAFARFRPPEDGAARACGALFIGSNWQFSTIFAAPLISKKSSINLCAIFANYLLTTEVNESKMQK